MLHDFVGEQLPDGVRAGDGGGDDGEEEQRLLLAEHIGSLGRGKDDEWEIPHEARLELRDISLCFVDTEKTTVDDVGYAL